eukprot:2137382-Rhodomonas_salina.1
MQTPLVVPRTLSPNHLQCHSEPQVGVNARHALQDWFRVSEHQMQRRDVRARLERCCEAALSAVAKQRFRNAVRSHHARNAEKRHCCHALARHNIQRLAAATASQQQQREVRKRNLNVHD